VNERIDKSFIEIIENIKTDVNILRRQTHE